MESETVKVKVRFSDADALRIVWHGNYVRYMEDARDAYCLRQGWDFERMTKLGYVAPVFNLEMHYHHPAKIGEELLVTATLQPIKSAKLVFDYEIKRTDGLLIMTGQTTQLFTDLEGNLVATRPPFLDSIVEESPKH